MTNFYRLTEGVGTMVDLDKEALQLTDKRISTILTKTPEVLARELRISEAEQHMLELERLAQEANIRCSKIPRTDVNARKEAFREYSALNSAHLRAQEAYEKAKDPNYLTTAERYQQTTPAKAVTTFIAVTTENSSRGSSPAQAEPRSLKLR